MRMSRSIGYAFAALGTIARAENNHPTMARKIAQAHQIPLEYLLKILQQLSRSGVIQGIRGPRGGFLLNQKAQEITLLHVIEAVEGSFVSNHSAPANSNPFQLNEKLCQSFRRAAEQAADVLSQTTLADLLDHENQDAGNIVSAQ